MRIADERLECFRPRLIVAISSAVRTLRIAAIFLSSAQKASSRLTLVRCPSISIDRLLIGEISACLN